MVVSDEIKLTSNNNSAFSYESFGDSFHFTDVSSPDRFINDLIKGNDVVHLKQLVPQSSPELRENEKNSWSSPPLLFYLLPSIFSLGVTVALVLHIFLDQSLVCNSIKSYTLNLNQKCSAAVLQVLVTGVLVSDHERCTAVGQQVFSDGGSSVDAAVASMLCVGVVHPHATGVGGGGVMLVRDIRRNQTKVIDFQGSAPKALMEKMQKRNASELEAGLQVAVPGLLMGLYHAHRLYGRLSWEDVVSRAADVAREGFSVSHSLAAAIARVKDQRLSQRFLEVFIPRGQPLSPGSFVKIPALAGVLHAGLMHFYHGSISQEIEDEVQANGGVLSREDISNYRTVEETPLEEHDDEFIIQVPPLSSAAAAFISALKLLQTFHLREKNIRQNQSSHWITETFTGSAAGLDGLHFNSSFTFRELLSHLLSKDQALQVLNASRVHSPSDASVQEEQEGGQVVVMGSDDLMVSVASSLSRTFGSRLITRSGIILNSLLLDFSIINNDTEAPMKQKRPVSFLMPTLLISTPHKCVVQMALSSSAVQNYLRAITQMLNAAVLFHKKKNDSLASRRLFNSSDFSEDIKQFGHQLVNMERRSSVWGILRNKDVFSIVKGRQLIESLIVFLFS
ncbi:glutathione hydrolase 7-like [Gouania willdenowi]|uniref:glutathione hydrolase 7-like n=1 Tax=Gouania willdenowi TaxID=441366 RepID=UPI0010554593|nr:glutathione hydrolase 7-like [Gouania willdenowi]